MSTIKEEINEFVQTAKKTSRISRLKDVWPQIGAALAMSSVNSIKGLIIAYAAILVPQLLDKNSTIFASKTEMSLIASLSPLVSIFGSLPTAYLMDHLGRVKALKYSIIFGIVGWFLIAIAQNITTVIVGIILSSFFGSLLTSYAMVYITEIASKNMRSSLTSLPAIHVSLGLTFVYACGWFLHWRSVAWLCQAYILSSFIPVSMIPESPAWLIFKGRHEDARKSLSWLHKNDESIIEQRWQELIKLDERKKTQTAARSGIIEEFRKPTGYKPLILNCTMFAFHVLTGSSVIVYHLITFVKTTGTTISPHVVSVLTGAIRLPAVLSLAWLLNHFSKRLLIMISAAAMSLSMATSALFTQWIQEGTTQHAWAPGVLILLYNVSAGLGFFPIPFTMTAEMYPLKIRSTGSAIVMATSNIITFLALQWYMDFESAVGGSARSQWVFAGFSAVAVLFVYVFLPDTSNKELSEIEEYFKNNTCFITQKNRKKTEVTETIKEMVEGAEQEDTLLNKI